MIVSFIILPQIPDCTLESLALSLRMATCPEPSPNLKTTIFATIFATILGYWRHTAKIAIWMITVVIPVFSSKKYI